MDRGDRAVVLDAGLELELDRMAAAVRVEHLLARQRDLHRPARAPRQKRRRELVRERFRLAAEAAADRRRDDAHLAAWHAQHRTRDAVQIVRSLRAAPQREFAVAAVVRDDRMLLDRRMSVAFEEILVFEDAIGVGETGLDVAELK